MLQIKRIISFGLLLFMALQSHAAPQYKAQDNLLLCRDKQIQPLHGQYLAFSFAETKSRLYSSFEPWQTYTSKSKGTVFIGADNLYKIDSTADGKYVSKTQFTKTELLFLNFGDTTLQPVTKGDYIDEIFDDARYSPILLIDYFIQHKTDAAQERAEECSVYTLTINKTIVKLFIRAVDDLVQKVTMMNEDDIYGDVTSTFIYSGYASVSGLYVARVISIEKVNGKVNGEVIVSNPTIAHEPAPLLNKPSDYQMKEGAAQQDESETVQDESETVQDVTVEKYNDNIHFIHLKHADSESLLVEFSDFLLVAEAPLTPENGEMIIREASKIAPGKPIKYFLFGHFHTWYTGGLRAFVRNGTTILTTDSDLAYVQYLASAPHTLQPDSLQLHPTPLKTEVIGEHKTITDGTYTMEVYCIGKKSKHAADYLIYYFPKEKLLFEDDLVWVKKEGALQKAGERQAGLYNAIKDLNVDVHTIVQSWPVDGYGIKSVIPFTDLEQSVNIK